VRYFLWLLFLLLSVAAAEAKIKAVDGDSLEINGRRIRLLGIDAPEYRQVCYNGKGEKYRCGIKALDYLKKQLKGGKVKCRKVKKDVYRRDLSICYVNGEDINRRMLAAGWAVAYRTKKEKYLEAEKSARRKRRGVWQGKFMKPELYRILSR